MENVPENLGFCGVDCSACPDFTGCQCPSCRLSEWTEETICPPVKCCRDRGISICGQCDEFPCEMMAEFYVESDSHRQAGERMRAVFEESKS